MAPGVKRCDKLYDELIFRIMQFITIMQLDRLNGLQINLITLPFKDHIMCNPKPSQVRLTASYKAFLRRDC